MKMSLSVWQFKKITFVLSRNGKWEIMAQDGKKAEII